MGTRINYELGSPPSVILFSNSHHGTEDPEAIFRETVAKVGAAPTALTVALLQKRYKTSDRAHQAGDPMFTVDLYPDDREKVLWVDFEAHPPVVHERAA